MNHCKDALPLSQMVEQIFYGTLLAAWLPPVPTAVTFLLGALSTYGRRGLANEDTTHYFCPKQLPFNLPNVCVFVCMCTAFVRYSYGHFSNWLLFLSFLSMLSIIWWQNLTLKLRYSLKSALCHQTDCRQAWVNKFSDYVDQGANLWLFRPQSKLLPTQ